MAVVDDLEATWKQISEALVQGGVAVFPEIPRLEATASFPGPDWRAFVALAGRVGAPIVYASQTVLDVEEIATFREFWFEEERPRPLARRIARVPFDAREATPEEKAVVRELSAYEGQVCEIRIAFAAGGVLHVWHAEAPWWNDLLRRAGELRDGRAEEEEHEVERAMQQQAAVADRARSEQWAKRLAESLQFLGARTERDKVQAAYEVLPDLPRPPEGLPRGRGSRLAHELIREATPLAEDEVKPRLTRQALDELESLGAEVARDPEWAIAGTKAARTAVVNRCLKAKFGFVMPAVASELASRKP